MERFLYELIETTHPDWQPLLKNAVDTLDPIYVNRLKEQTNWLPGLPALFACFSRPLHTTRYILLGESPYPRIQSANGYAFWDNAVSLLWSPAGLSKQVNRATSLRNFIKMLLVARGDLQQDTSQEAIASLDKSVYWQRGQDFFTAFIDQGFLLLNASLVYDPNTPVRFHARQWQPFMACLFTQLATYNPSLCYLLFGRIASFIPETHYFSCLIAEHPYNLSFIVNPSVLAFFKPLDLLSAYDK